MEKKHKLEKEEKNLLESFEKEEWLSVSDKEARIKRYAQYAKNTLKKDKRISIRMSGQDYIGIQVRAMEEGIPYQTLITSIVHKYILGTLRSDREKEAKKPEEAKK
ncbi:MAG: antitoxin [Candidatus Omnitrophota bacterium]